MRIISEKNCATGEMRTYQDEIPELTPGRIEKTEVEKLKDELRAKGVIE